MRKFIILLVFIAFISCTHRSTSTDENEAEENNEIENKIHGYRDGTYCAEIEYYYSKTGTRSEYTLEIEIENNLLVKILWPNGGWLDESHYNPPDIENGHAEFTSDAGVDYTVDVIENASRCYTSNYVKEEKDLVNQYEDERAEELRIKRQREDEERQQQQENNQKEENENDDND